MDDRINTCREIDLIDLLKKIIASWKLIFIFVIVSILIVGVFQYNRVQKSNAELLQSAPMDILTDEEKGEIQEALFLKEQIVAREDYFNNSFLMRLDPYHMKIFVLQYYINQEDTVISDIHSLYNTYISNGGIADDVKDRLAWNIDSKYVTELLQIVQESGGTSKTEQDQESKLLIVKVRVPNDKEGAMLSDAVNKAIFDYKKVIEKEIGKFEMRLISSEESVVVDKQTAETQNAFINELEWFKQKLNTQKANFNEVQNSAFMGESLSVQEKSIKSILLKEILFGFIVGLILGCIYVVCYYLFSSKIQSLKEIEAMYGCNIIGNWKLTKNQSDEDCQMMAIRSVALCKKNKIQNLLITSSISIENEISKKIEILMKYLEENDIHVCFFDSLEKNIEAYKSLVNSDAVLDIERIDKSKYVDIEKQIVLFNEQEKMLLGMIMVSN